MDTLVDTGATVSLLSDKVVKRWSKQDQASVVKTDIKVLLADNKALPVAGEVEAELQLQGIVFGTDLLWLQSEVKCYWD